jgi:N-acetylneuraminic acid mutarotase
LIGFQAPDSFFSQIVSGVYHWDPPTKQESMLWVHKAKTVFGRKIHGNHFVGLERNSAYFYGKRHYNQWRDLFEDNSETLKLKRPSSCRQKNLLLLDNCKVQLEKRWIKCISVEGISYYTVWKLLME